MTVRSFSTLLLGIGVLGAHAQSFDHFWSTTLGGTSAQLGKVLHLDPDANVVVAGTFQDEVVFPSPSGPDSLHGHPFRIDLYLAKFDPYGHPLWRHTFRCTTQEDLEVTRVLTDSEGNILLSGHGRGNVDLDPGPDTVLMQAVNQRSFVVKYDPDGNYLWHHVLKSTGSTGTFITTMEMGSTDDVYIAVQFTQGLDVHPHPDTTLLINGSSNSNAVIRYGTDGSYRDHHFFRSPSAWDSNIRNMVVGEDGQVVVHGNIRANDMWVDGPAYPQGPVLHSLTGGDIFLIKMNADLEPIWWGTMGSNDNEHARAMACDAEGNVYIAGQHLAPIDMDPSEEEEWTLVNPTSASASYLGKYDAQGQLIWARDFIGPFGTPWQLAFDPDGALVLLFTFAYELFLNPDEEGLTLPGNGPTATGGIARLDPATGTAFVAAQLGSGAYMNQVAACMDIGADGRIALTDVLRGTMDVDPGNGTVLLTSTHGDDAYVMVLGPCSTLWTGAPEVSLITSTDSLCAGQSAVVRIPVPGPFQVLTWSDGSTSDTLVVTEPGTYSATLGNTCAQWESGSITINDCGVITGLAPSATAMTTRLLADPDQDALSLFWNDASDHHPIGSVLTIDGRLVHHVPIGPVYPGSVQHLQLPTRLSTGAYLLRILTTDGTGRALPFVR